MAENYHIFWGETVLPKEEGSNMVEHRFYAFKDNPSGCFEESYRGSRGDVKALNGLAKIVLKHFLIGANLRSAADMLSSPHKMTISWKPPYDARVKGDLISRTYELSAHEKDAFLNALTQPTKSEVEKMASEAGA